MVLKKREEYLQERKIYIEGMRKSSEEFQKYIFLTASGLFIYSISFYKDATFTLKFSRILFGIIVIINIISYYLSSLANEYRLERYDSNNQQKKDNYKNKAEDFNKYIEDCAQRSIILIIIAIFAFAIFFLGV